MVSYILDGDLALVLQTGIEPACPYRFRLYHGLQLPPVRAEFDNEVSNTLFEPGGVIKDTSFTSLWRKAGPDIILTRFMMANSCRVVFKYTGSGSSHHDLSSESGH